MVDGHQQQGQPQYQGQRPADQSLFEIDDLKEPRQPGVFGHQPFADRKDLREHGKGNGLIAAENRQAGKQQGVRVKGQPLDRQPRHR